MIDPALRTSLAAFDDAALATLANPGLVRRAHRDLAEGKIKLIGCSGGVAEVEADGNVVRIDARGPGPASCACKTLAVCRHRIAAVLFLQAAEFAEEAADKAAPKVVAESAPAEPFDPVALLATLAPAALVRWAGKASWRAALELAGGPAAVEVQGQAIAVTLADTDEPILLLRGQGFDGIVSKVAKTRRKAVHAAAVLLARRHFALADPDLSDSTTTVTAQAELASTDPAFLTRISRALGEVATLGFNLAPLPLEESLFELSVSTRADALPRLSAMLRGIAAQMRLRRQRVVAFDPDAMMELTATAFALTRALGSGATERQTVLAGKVRRDFGAAPPLALLGCGGERWRTPSGARGVTAWFVEEATGRWLSATLARGPGQDPQFVPGQAWQRQAMWQAGPLARLAHARFVLEGANISADGRLSAPTEALATISASAVLPSADASGIIRDWSELRTAYLRQAGLGLDASPAPTACLLAPSATATPYFDDLAQQLIWPLRDATGAWLALTLEQEEPISVAIEALEATVRAGWQGLVLAKLGRAGPGLTIAPLSLLSSAGLVDLSLWQGQRSTSKEGARSWLERLRPRATSQVFARVPRRGTRLALDAVWRHLIDRAEAGPGLMAVTGGDLAGHAERLDSYGLPVLAGLIRRSTNADGLLIATYGVLVARQQRCEVPMLV